jgi:hypothetical protein
VIFDYSLFTGHLHFFIFAGVVQWQNASFPSWTRGFDSLHPLFNRRKIFDLEDREARARLHAKLETGSRQSSRHRWPKPGRIDSIAVAGFTNFLAWRMQQRARSVLNTTALTITSIVTQGFSLASGSPCWSPSLPDSSHTTPLPQI